MNREILFRGKVKLPINLRGHQTSYRNGDWVYGLMNSNESVRGVFVDRNTIGQYTGLTDKNGTKIFEGDIVQTLNFKTAFNVDKFSVRFVQGNFYVCLASTIWTLRSCYEDVVVVGNIYDNPELLQEGD